MLFESISEFEVDQPENSILMNFITKEGIAYDCCNFFALEFYFIFTHVQTRVTIVDRKEKNEDTGIN